MHFQWDPEDVDVLMFILNNKPLCIEYSGKWMKKGFVRV